MTAHTISEQRTSPCAALKPDARPPTDLVAIGEPRRHLSDRTWDGQEPCRLRELRLAIFDANSSLLQALGRSPTVADVAVHLRITEEEVLEGLEGARAYNAVSTPTGDGDRVTELDDVLSGAGSEL